MARDSGAPPHRGRTLFPEGRRTRETAQALIDRVMAAIRAQGE